MAKRRWAEEEMLAVMASYIRRHAILPTADEYMANRGELPDESTIRTRLGGWTQAWRRALRIALDGKGADVPLGQLTPKRAELKLRDDLLIKLYLEGKSYPEIAEALGLPVKSPQQAYERVSLLVAHLRKQGHDLQRPRLRKGGKRVPPDALERTTELYRQGLNQSQIAREMGISNQNVSVRLKKMREAGQLPPQPRRVSGGLLQKTAELFLQGMTPAEIAQTLGVTSAATHTRIHKLRKSGVLPPAPAPGVSRQADENPRQADIEARINEVAQRRISGETIREIAAVFGVTSQRVAQLAQKAEVRGLLVARGDVNESRVTDLLTAGLSAEQIAAQERIPLGYLQPLAQKAVKTSQKGRNSNSKKINVLWREIALEDWPMSNIRIRRRLFTDDREGSLKATGLMQSWLRQGRIIRFAPGLYDLTEEGRAERTQLLVEHGKNETQLTEAGVSPGKLDEHEG